MSEKPVIFISHAHFDAPIVNSLHEQLKSVFGDEVHIFNSSRRGGIGIGKRWLNDIETNIDTAKVFILLITPASIEKHWIWFELGAFWLKRRDKDGLYPLSVGLAPEHIPEPLKQLQIQSLDEEDGIKLIFETLHGYLKIGNLALLDSQNMISQLVEHRPTYTKLLGKEDKSVTLNEPYSSALEGYSDATLQEYIDDYLYHQYLLFKNKLPNLRGIVLAFNPYSRQVSIFTGKIVLYDELDREIGLPLGKSKQLLKKKAKMYGLVPITGREHDDSIRFRYNSGMDIYLSKDT